MTKRTYNQNETWPTLRQNNQWKNLALKHHQQQSTWVWHKAGMIMSTCVQYKAQLFSHWNGWYKNLALKNHQSRYFQTHIQQYQIQDGFHIGSKFCPIAELKSIYVGHNLFPFFYSLHQHCTEYFYKDTLSDSEQMAVLEANIAQRNHKSTTSRPMELLEKLFRDFKYEVWLLMINSRSIKLSCQWLEFRFWKG